MGVPIIRRERPTFGEQIGAGLGGGVSKGFSDALMRSDEAKSQQKKFQQELALQRERSSSDFSNKLALLREENALKSIMNQQDFYADQENFDKIRDAFGDSFANIWKASPTGARTALTQAALEAKLRGLDIDKFLSKTNSENISEEVFEEEAIEENAPVISKIEPPKNIKSEIKKYVSSQDKDLLPSEKISRGKERYDTGLKFYQEAGEKLRGLDRDKERLNILEDLSKSQKLPSSLGRLNVDAEGNLRIPFLATPQAERYVKTLNEFSSGAKDTFGSRVTNFDLTQYLKRFPTLLNSPEGRKQLLDQMKIVNQINSVYYKNLKNVYDQAGGVRNIDSDAAERFAEQLSEGKIKELSDKFSRIGQFTSLPEASEFKGRKIKDTATGEIFISNGTEWEPAT